MHLNDPGMLRDLRRQISVFLFAVIAFIVVIQLVYLLSLPKTDDYYKLKSIFMILGILEMIVVLILAGSLALYGKRIWELDIRYGRAVLWEALIFIGANLIAGSFNLWLG